MNGQLLLLLLSMLLQNPSSEILPEPNRNGTAFGGATAILPGNPVSTPTPMLAPVRGRRQVGYASDPLDGNKFCLILQIPPEELGEFARGPAGQELTASIPDEIRNFRIDKIIFRIGTDPVEKFLPNQNALSENRPFAGTPQIVDLNNRSTVAIDQPRPQSNLATVAQNGAGFSGNTTMPNNGLDSSYNPNLNNQANGLRPEVMPFGQNTTQTRDGFTAKPSPFNNFLVPNQNNTANPPYASSTYPYGAGTSTHPNALAPNPNRPFNLASNTTNTPPYYDNQFGQQNSQQLPQSGYAPTPSASLTNQYGQPVSPQPSYVSSNLYPTPQATSYSLTPPPVREPPYKTASVDLEEPQPKDKLLPFLLLFSIVVNLYLGFWMSYLRNRYRQLLSNTRGIPLADLA